MLFLAPHLNKTMTTQNWPIRVRRWYVRKVKGFRVYAYRQTDTQMYRVSFHKEHILLMIQTPSYPLGSWNFQTGHHLWQKEGNRYREQLQQLLKVTRKESGTMQTHHVCFRETGEYILPSWLGKELEQEWQEIKYM